MTGGCESGFAVPDPADPNIVWSTCYGNKVTRYDHRTKIARSVAPWMITLDSPPQDSKYRCHWTAPIAIDPFDHNNVFYGCNVIFQTTNGGQSWKVISPDLSTQDASKIISSGGIVGDNLGQFAPAVIFSIAFSEVEKGLVWAGTNDGKLWSSRDGGAKWNDVTKNVTGLPAWSMVTKIEPSRFDGGTAYVAVDHHLMDSREPYIFKTTDHGATWTRVNGDLPNAHPLSYVRAVAENPNRRGMLFAGTGRSFYYSKDDGAHWTELSTGLPHAPVSWVAVQKAFHDVVVSTYGRGLYVLDDITPLEQEAASTTEDAHLFAPRPAYRWSQRGRAFINYSIKSAPRGPIQLQIVDGDGKVVRDLRPNGREGLNRASWDLRHDPPRLVALRTTPAENPHIWEEPRFRGQDTRPVTHWGLEPAQVGPIVAPGKYTVKLTVDDRNRARPEGRHVHRGPRSVGPPAAALARQHQRGRRHGQHDRGHAQAARGRAEGVSRRCEQGGAAGSGRRDGQEARRGRVDAARAGTDDQLRQVFSAGLPRLHEPDLAERRSRTGRRRRFGRSRLSAD